MMTSHMTGRFTCCRTWLLVLVLASGLTAGLTGCQDEQTSGTASSADAVPISYQVHGQGEVAVVLVHCWSCDGGYWREQVDVLARDYQVVTIDLAGHGESGLARQDYTMPAFGADVAAVVEQLGLQRVILVGHSMGGTVIVEAAGLLSGRVLGLIAVDTLHKPGFGFSAEQVDQLLAPMREDFAGTTESFVRSMFPADADSALVDWVAGDMAASPPEVSVSAMSNLLLFDPKPTLAKLQVPIVCLDADKHPVIAKDWEFYAGDYSHEQMSGVGHFLQLEAPAAFNERLLAAVAKLAGG